MSHDQMIKARSLLSEAADFIDKIRVGVTVKARSGMVAKLRAFVAGDTGPRCEIVASRTDKLPRLKRMSLHPRPVTLQADSVNRVIL